MRHLILAAITCLVITSCGNQSSPKTVVAQQSETDNLNAWFEVKYEEELMMGPLGLTF
jgi:hypothetical protein